MVICFSSTLLLYILYDVLIMPAAILEPKVPNVAQRCSGVVKGHFQCGRSNVSSIISSFSWAS